MPSEDKLANSIFMTKLCLIIFNGGRILQRLAVFMYNVYTDSPYIHQVKIHSTVNGTNTVEIQPIPFSFEIMALAIFVAIHSLGIIGPIIHSRRCLITYSSILFVFNIISLFAPTFDLSIFIIYMVMIVLAVGFTMILKQRELIANASNDGLWMT